MADLLQGGRELGRMPNGGGPANGGDAAAAANAELKGIQFRAVTAFNRLRDDVGRLGSAADTVDLRRRIADGGQRFKALAQEFRQKVAAHPARDSSAAQKLLRDFQGLLKSSERLMETARAKEAASLPRQPGGAAASAAAAQQEQQSAAEREAAERQALLEAQRKQELLAVENQLQFNEAVIEERDHAIIEISGQIGEVRLPARLRWLAAGRQRRPCIPALPLVHPPAGATAGLTSAASPGPRASRPCPPASRRRCTRSSRTWLCW
jgi:syntaxin 7